MNIEVSVRSEQHDTILTLREALTSVPPPHPEWPTWELGMVPLDRRPDFPLLRGIDPYGNTCFNSRQAELLVPELDTLDAMGLDPAQNAVARAVRVLLAVQLSRPHRYLWFLGD